MTGFDYVVLAIIGFSVLLSCLRGLSHEVLSLAGWLVSAWLAFHLAGLATVYVPDSVSSPAFRYLTALVIIFVVSWLGCLTLRLMVLQFLRFTGLTLLDRVLGMAFGLVRGFLLVLLLVLLGGLTPLPHSELWHNALFRPVFERAAMLVLPWLPQDISGHINYD